ncbi:DUF350 domain-containing protein [Dactylosporangium sucinum]|uniref:DUF350 domain-containing protein n=1 Tax=Dactylosporangium sucinum TaxID=1424081 RepID=A0A917T6Y1_9ACTN|nr:DUF350 domain-containing protein [Dactylosporangium sucinum]GGM11945.1 hypothetical protein GCM10007977_011410 [Dactylosporangium sucinum]
MNDLAPLIAVLQVLIVVVGVGGGWWLLNALTSFDDHDELWIASNWAYLLQRVGFVFVQVVGVSSLVGQDLDKWSSLAWVGGGLVWATVLAVVGFVLTDLILLRTRPTKLNELDRIPMSIALVRLGFYLGLGLVVRATFVGSAPDLRTALLATLAFTAAGVAGLVIAFYLHALVVRGNLREAVAAGGVTEGLESAAVLTSVGLILYGAMAGDFTTWPESFAGFGMALGVAYVGLYIARYVIDWFVLTGECTLKTIHEQQQKAAAALLAFLLVMVALPISAVVNLYVE